MTAHWWTMRRALRVGNIVMAAVGVLLLGIGQERGWTLLLIALCGMWTWWEPKGEWEPYKFPTRKERKAAEAARQIQ